MHADDPTVHLVFKTHLDVGFTDLAKRVVDRYIDHYLPEAMALARNLREQGSGDRFVWTTGSWLISEFLERADRASRAAMEQAIMAGDVVWHALPFTLHTELLDELLLDSALAISTDLDRRFGRRTIAAKMTDVPGHTAAIVPHLVERGIEFLHLGVNPASTPPSVPPAFRWRFNDSLLAVIYSSGDYGDTTAISGLSDVLALIFTGDNQGPQSELDVRQVFDRFRQRFPESMVRGSTLDDFAIRLRQVVEELPVVESEIGDTWNHGLASDPTKVARLRELLGVRHRWLRTGQLDEDSRRRVDRELLLVCEHTWGMDVKVGLGDDRRWVGPEFQQLKGSPEGRRMKASWLEQHEYLHRAMDSLPPSLAEEANAQLNELEPRWPDLSLWHACTQAPISFTLSWGTVLVDPFAGAVAQVQLKEKEGEGARFDGPLCRLIGQRYASIDYERFAEAYLRDLERNGGWALPDFTKPGIDGLAASASVLSRPKQAFVAADGSPTALLHSQLPLSREADQEAPIEVWMQVTAHPTLEQVSIDLQLFDKSETRLPEAIWVLVGQSRVEPPHWRVNKIGHMVDCENVVPEGNRLIHGVGGPVIGNWRDGRRLEIDSKDAVLFAPFAPTLLNFGSSVSTPWSAFNLYNNMWGTNFPLWQGGDFRFRFDLRFSSDPRARD